MAKVKREIWVHEMQDKDGKYVPIGMGRLATNETGMSNGLAAGYRLKSDAVAAGRVPRWSDMHHRLVKYVPEDTKAGK